MCGGCGDTSAPHSQVQAPAHASPGIPGSSTTQHPNMNVITGFPMPDISLFGNPGEIDTQVLSGRFDRRGQFSATLSRAPQEPRTRWEKLLGTRIFGGKSAEKERDSKQTEEKTKQKDGWTVGDVGSCLYSATVIPGYIAAVNNWGSRFKEGTEIMSSLQSTITDTCKAAYKANPSYTSIAALAALGVVGAASMAYRSLASSLDEEEKEEKVKMKDQVKHVHHKDHHVHKAGCCGGDEPAKTKTPARVGTASTSTQTHSGEMSAAASASSSAMSTPPSGAGSGNGASRIQRRASHGDLRSAGGRRSCCKSGNCSVVTSGPASLPTPPSSVRDDSDSDMKTASKVRKYLGSEQGTSHMSAPLIEMS